jgi:hypothetical protein
MAAPQIIIDLLQNPGGLLGLAGFVLSAIALVVSLRSAYTDRVSSNSWEIYRAYNSAAVRAGRAIALHLAQDTRGRGLPTYAEYRAYFGLDAAPTSSTDQVGALQADRQHLHDLAAFYHQTGVLLTKRHLDRDFTLLLVGPGLEDRWTVLYPLAGYYEPTDGRAAAFPYGGMYLLYQAYLKWKRSHYGRLRRRFARARKQTAARKA